MPRQLGSCRNGGYWEFWPGAWGGGATPHQSRTSVCLRQTHRLGSDNPSPEEPHPVRGCGDLTQEVPFAAEESKE